MSTTALFMMILVMGSVTVITGYFLFRVLLNQQKKRRQETDSLP